MGGYTKYELCVSFKYGIRSSRPEVFSKKMFLKISQNSQENTSARVPFLIKLQASGLKLYLKIRLWHRSDKFSWTSFLQSTFEWLLLGFPCNFTKMGQCQQCLENNKYSLSSNKYFYLEKLTLEVPFRYIISFSAV